MRKKKSSEKNVAGDVPYEALPDIDADSGNRDWNHIVAARRRVRQRAETAPRPLTPEQREEYADMLRDGVPEAVVEEFAADLDQDIERWKKQVGDHVRSLKKRKNRGRA